MGEGFLDHEVRTQGNKQSWRGKHGLSRRVLCIMLKSMDLILKFSFSNTVGKIIWAGADSFTSYAFIFVIRSYSCQVTLVFHL